MRIFVCDDEASTAAFLKKLITDRYGNRHAVYTFADVKSMLACEEKADILISDIRIDEVNGIDGAAELLKKAGDVKVIFFTAYPMEYFEDIFTSLRPFGFLGKPINEERLFDHIDRIVEEAEKNKTLEFLSKGVMCSLPLNSVVFIESHGRQKYIVTGDDTWVTNMAFDDLLPRLNRDFARSHIAYVVNLDYVSKLTDNGCLLTNGSEIPVSRKYKAAFRDAYFMFKGKKRQ